MCFCLPSNKVTKKWTTPVYWTQIWIESAMNLRKCCSMMTRLRNLSHLSSYVQEHFRHQHRHQFVVTKNLRRLMSIQCIFATGKSPILTRRLHIFILIYVSFVCIYSDTLSAIPYSPLQPSDISPFWSDNKCVQLTRAERYIIFVFIS